MTKLPSYEQLVIELHATLESLINYSKSEYVRQLAKDRMKEIEQIRKNGGGIYLASPVNLDKKINTDAE
jgi:hypothetical protein